MNGDNTGLKGKRINHKSNASLKGFTLVELIVVLVILTIIAAVAVPAMLGYTDSAKEKEYISDAESAYNAAQAALTDLYNDASNEFNHKKRLSVAEIAGLNPDNSRFKIWTAKTLMDGVTSGTAENIGSYTLEYALYETSNDGNGFKVFYDGKNWTVYDDDDDLADAMTNVGIGLNSENIIYMWPDYSNGQPYDNAYNPNKNIEEEQWVKIDENDNSYSLKLHNYNGVQGKSEPGVKFYKDGIATDKDTLKVEFEDDEAAGITSLNWTSEKNIEYESESYQIECVYGFRNLRWSVNKTPDIESNEGIYTYDEIKAKIKQLNADGITEVYAVTDKTIHTKNIVFKCLDGSNAFSFLNGEKQLQVKICRYINPYDCDDYNKNKSLNKGAGSIVEAKNITINSGYEVNKWALFDGSNYEYSGEKIKPYDVNTEEEIIWSKVFSIKTDAIPEGENPDSDIEETLDGYSFVGISKKVKKVRLYADSKNCSSFKGAKSLEFREEYNELLEERTDNFDDYNSKPLEPNPGYRHLGWEEYNVNSSVLYQDISEIWNEVKTGDKNEYAYIAKVTYGSKAKFLAVSGADDTSETSLAGQMYALFGGNRKKSNLELYFHKKSYPEAISLLKSAGIIDQLMTGYDDSDAKNDAAIPCGDAHCNSFPVNASVEGGTITRITIMWDGNDLTYSIPIFAYNIVSDKSYHVYWFSREDRPELVGNFSTTFKDYYNINFSDSHMADWNTSSCDNMSEMFMNSGIGDNQINFKKWDYSALTDMTGMFQNCDNLRNFSFENCEIPVCTSFKNLFYDCNGLANVKFDNLKTQSLISVDSMFKMNSNSKPSLVSFSARGWNAENLPSLKELFKDKTTLQHADFRNSDDNITNLSSCISFEGVFNGCTGLNDISLEGVNLQSCQIINNLFNSCTSLTLINLNNCNMESVTKKDNMLSNVNDLTTFYAKGWNIRKVSSFKEFFKDKKKLENVDFGKYVKGDEEIITDMSGCTSVENMFLNCVSLTTVSFEGVNLCKCVTVSKMMNNCKELNTITFNYCNMSGFKGQFKDDFLYGDDKLKYFYAKGWDIKQSEGLYKFFDRGYTTGTLPDFTSGNFGKAQIEEVDFSDADMSSLKTLYYAFDNCPKLKKVTFEGTKVRKSTDTTTVNCEFCFFHCFDLEEVNFNFADGTTLRPSTMFKFFDFCQKLNRVIFVDEGEDWHGHVSEKLDTSSTKNMKNVFYQCYNLKNVDPFYEEFDFSSVTEMWRMFMGADLEGVSVKFIGKDMSKVVNCQQMFMATNIEKVSFINCNLNGLTNNDSCKDMFSFDCTGYDPKFVAEHPVKEIDFTGTTMNSVTNISKLFSNCIALEKLTLDKCEMKKVTSVPQSTFNNDNNLKEFYARGWNIGSDTSGVSFNKMFYQRSGLQLFDISDYVDPQTGVITYTNISKCTVMSSMFNACTSLKTVIFPENIDMKKVTTFNNMFTDCSVFTRAAFSDMLSKWNLENSTVNFGVPSGDGAANIFVGRNTVDFFETLECYSADGQHFSIGGNINDRKFKALRKID